MTAPRYTNAEMADRVAATVGRLRVPVYRVVVETDPEGGPPLRLEVRSTGEVRIVEQSEPEREVKCRAPRRHGRYRGEPCGRFVTRAPAGYVLRFVSLVGHSTLADPAHHVAACTHCAMLHELRAEPAPLALADAA